MSRLAIRRHDKASQLMEEVNLKVEHVIKTSKVGRRRFSGPGQDGESSRSALRMPCQRICKTRVALSTRSGQKGKNLTHHASPVCHSSNGVSLAFLRSVAELTFSKNAHYVGLHRF